MQIREYVKKITQKYILKKAKQNVFPAWKLHATFFHESIFSSFQNFSHKASKKRSILNI